MTKSKAGEQTQAIGFVRVANKTQESVNSMVMQQNAIYAYAVAHNIEIVEWVEIAGSGSQNNLGILLEAISKLGSVDKVLVYNLNRLTRNLYDYYEINRELATRDISVISVTEPGDDTAIGKYLRNLHILIAQMDNDSRSEIIKELMARKAEKGYHLSKPPLGYSQGTTKGVHEINNDGRVLQKGFQDVLSGEMTMPELRDVISRIYFPLSVSEYRTISKTHFTKIVSSAYYSGLIEYKGNTYQGLHDPLLTPEEQEKLKGLLDS